MIWQFLLTGAAGHLAHAIALELTRKGYAVRGLILQGERVAVPGVETVTGDVTRPETLEALFAGVDPAQTVLIHTAGLITLARAETPLLHRVNVEGTRNVAEVCLRHGVRMVYVSSVHALPEGKRGEVLRETRHFDPALVRGGYARTKAEATRLVLAMTAQGLDAVVVHPSGIIGPYDRGGNRLTQLIADCMAQRLPAGVRGGYDFVDVRDAAAGTVAAALHGETGECYLLTGRYATIGELLGLVRLVAGGRQLACVPLWMAKVCVPLLGLVARARGERPLYTAYALYTLGSRARFSHEKATRELAYAPRPLEETVEDTVLWLRRRE